MPCSKGRCSIHTRYLLEYRAIPQGTFLSVVFFKVPEEGTNLIPSKESS